MSDVTRSDNCWVWLACMVAEASRKVHLQSICVLRCSETEVTFSAIATARSSMNMF